MVTQWSITCHGWLRQEGLALGNENTEDCRKVLSREPLGRVLILKTGRYDYSNVINVAWHSHENIISFTSSDGELYIYTDFVPADFSALLEQTLQPAPFIHDPLAETSGNARRRITNGVKDRLGHPMRRGGSPDSLDDILGSDGMGEDEDDFIDDDDGAGYAAGINGFGKRTNGHLDDLDGFDVKRRAPYQAWQPKIHQSFQSGSTPWRGNRRYLCKQKWLKESSVANVSLGLNLTGFVWTVDQDTHHTVTVEFYDREFHRDFHFTDPYLYDKACLSMPLSQSLQKRVLT